MDIIMEIFSKFIEELNYIEGFFWLRWKLVASWNLIVEGVG